MGLHHFPELEGLEPAKGDYNKYGQYTGYWFPKGKLRPRIKLLRKAIERCEKTIQDEQAILNLKSIFHE